ncbi:fimbrial biogenesis chaperone [Kangiella sediminilitoris]|uniref:Pili assembly chaperone N-terminal domain-containing protein n=1 Tax=Kangiella sediminilitoris TaxID=1144748 RepID=A0A1B3B8H9_9GAMM|nr:fimbria/pilus periplasmic chaperone [Kangiella sediminilitoris]AOE49085.1 hypothetical protein KS2013_360 [Kangiella sediminilitoris]
MLKFLTPFILFSLVVFNCVEAAEAPKGLQPQLAISPSRIEISPDEGKSTKSVTVLNLGNTPMRVQVSVQNWDFDHNNNYRPLPPNEQSLDQWLIINPVQLEVPPKGQQTVRMAVRPRAKPEDGEHRAMVFFKQLNGGDEKGVNVRFNVGVPIYAFFGDVKREASLHHVNFNPKSSILEFDITNTGNAYVRPEGYYMLVDGATKESNEGLLSRLSAKSGEVEGVRPLATGKIASKPVFAGERRQLQVSISTEGELPDNYKLVVKADIAGELYEKVYSIAKDK